MICPECKQEWTMCNSESCDLCGADRHICSETHVAACLECIKKLREFVELIARMKTLGEIAQSGELYSYSDDDAVETLDELIASARQLTGIEPEPTKSEIVEAWAKENNVEVVTHPLAETTPVDLSGLPRKKKEGK